ncbi:MAG: disulfide bond formation protein B [Acidimicrobiia bacterium]|nr:disulfide bond formation protein B [Acidimicrobiia bacterium]
MDFSTYTQLTALFALFANAVTIGIVVVFAGGRFGVAPLARARDWLRVALQDVGVLLAAIVASASTIGSLLYSEAYNLIPCELCWYQRIAMYPLAVILVIAAVRRATGEARRYGIPLAVIGTVIAAYHYLIQQFPDLEAGSCSLDVPCSAPYVWQYDFISIPYMALAGFTLVLALLLATGRPE